jgi:hypothetical protein
LLLALASKVNLGSESHVTHDLILLSGGSGGLQTFFSFKERERDLEREEKRESGGW